MQIYDVIIVGGGISGTMASIAAAKNGAKVLLIEQYGFLGGMLTAGGVGPMMTFHAGSRQVIKGITGELIDRLVKKGKSPGHIVDILEYTATVTPFDAEALKHELECMLLEQGGNLLYHSMLAEAEVSEGNIKSITICNKAGLSKLYAKVFVDATGDADLSYMSGVECNKGRKMDGICQPMTMNFKMANVDIKAIKEYVRANPNELSIKNTISHIDEASRFSMEGFADTLKNAKLRGEITFDRENILFFETNNLGEVIINTSRIHRCDATDPWELSRAEIEGRRQVRELEKLLKEKVAGFRDAFIVCSGPSVGVRSSRQIRGLYCLTQEDLLECRKFYDVVAHSAYPIDIHNPDGTGKTHVKLKSGDYYSIPYRCMVNSSVHNLITAGRCISTTFEAQAAIRTTPTVGAIGQAGGLAASLAASGDLPARDININELQDILIAQGAYLER